MRALQDDTSLHSYQTKSCQVCHKSGVVKVRKCDRCKVTTAHTHTPTHTHTHTYTHTHTHTRTHAYTQHTHAHTHTYQSVRSHTHITHTCAQNLLADVCGNAYREREIEREREREFADMWGIFRVYTGLHAIAFSLFSPLFIFYTICRTC